MIEGGIRPKTPAPSLFTCLYKNACPSFIAEARKSLCIPTSPWLPGCRAIHPLMCHAGRGSAVHCYPVLLMSRSGTEKSGGWASSHVKLPNTHKPFFPCQVSRLNPLFLLTAYFLISTQWEKRGHDLSSVFRAQNREGRRKRKKFKEFESRGEGREKETYLFLCLSFDPHPLPPGLGLSQSFYFPYYEVILLVYSKFWSPCTCPLSFTTKAFQKHISKTNNNCTSLSTTELGNFNLVGSTSK